MTQSAVRKIFSGAWLPITLAFLLCVLAIYASRVNAVSIRMTVASDAPGRLQIFHDAQGMFTEPRSHWLDIGAKDEVELTLSGDDGLRVRLDPPAGRETAVCQLRVADTPGRAAYRVIHASEVSIREADDCLYIRSEADARDPQVHLALQGDAAARMQRAESWEWASWLAWLALAAVGLRLLQLLRPITHGWTSRIPLLPGLGTIQRWAHWACALIMLSFGALYIGFTPPGAVADEEAHLAKVIRISQGVPFGGADSRLMPDAPAMYGPFTGYLANKAPFTRTQLQTQLGKPVECVPRTTALHRGADSYFPHHYPLPVLAYVGSCASGASFGSFLYLARALNLLLATALVTWGVAMAARGKLGLLLIALLPMSLYQMSSISADALVLSLSIAWLGLVSGIATGGRSPKDASTALWGLGLAIAFLKPGSAWILVCLLFCKPAYDAAGMSFPAAVAKHILLPWMLHLLWTLSATSSMGSLLPGIDVAANLQTLFDDPWVGVEKLLLTLQVHGQHFARMMVGVLGWLDVPLSPWTYAVAGVLGLAAFWSNEEALPRLPPYAPLLALLASAGSLVLLALPLLIYWTPTGSPVIHGLQGRYFIATMAFVLVWCSFRAPAPLRALLAGLIIAGVVAINVDGILRLYEAYFVTGR